MAHWTIVKNILKYLRRTKYMLLVYGGDEELVVNGYTDASFMTDIDDYKSQSSYVFTLNGGSIVWKSFKPNTVADSRIETEYILRLQKLQRRHSGSRSFLKKLVWSQM